MEKKKSVSLARPIPGELRLEQSNRMSEQVRAFAPNRPRPPLDPTKSNVLNLLKVPYCAKFTRFSIR